jgi:Flp pilus assembly pilin Flp
MTNPQAQWTELANQVQALAQKVKLHFEQHGGPELKETLNTLRTTLEEAFTAAGNTIRDEDVREDAKQAGKLLGEAVAGTFAKVSEELREFVDRQRAPHDQPGPQDRPPQS